MSKQNRWANVDPSAVSNWSVEPNSPGKLDTMKTVTLNDFLTTAQLQQAWDIWEEVEAGKNLSRPHHLIGDAETFVTRCEREVIAPNRAVIDTKLGQQCDSRYLAYCVEYVFLSTKR